MIREGFLQQSAYDEVDAYCDMRKQFKLLKLFAEFHRLAVESRKRGVPLKSIRSMPIIFRLIRAKSEVRNDEVEKLDALLEIMKSEFEKLMTKEVVTTA